MDLLHFFIMLYLDYIYVNVRDENFITQSCQNIWDVATRTSMRRIFVIYYLTYLKLASPQRKLDMEIYMHKRYLKFKIK